MIIFAFIIMMAYMGFWARMHGGGWLGNQLDGLPIDLSGLTGVLFALPIAMVALASHGILVGLLAGIWSYYAFQTGHATAFNMGRNPSIAQSGRKEPLSYIVDPIANHFGWELGGVKYSWLFMAIKGLLIGLPMGLPALLLAALWPAGYEIGYHLPSDKYNTFFPEIVSGMFAGLVVVVALILL